MKKQLLFVLVLIFSANCYSQITFEKGYFINNSNKKIDCLIKNYDWANIPKKIEYKLSNETEQKRIAVNLIKEFGIYNVSKYIRQNVNIDRSSDITSELDNLKNPVLREEQLLIKVLIEGKASLYSFMDGNLKRYFYSLDNSEIEQLIYKRYITSQVKIAKNNQFKQQLFNSLKCEGINLESLKRIDYKERDLVNLFVKYNTCNDSKFINFENKKDLGLFKLSLKAGLNNSSLSFKSIVSDDSFLNTDFDNKTSFRFGVEAEFVFNFNKNKWAIFIEPTYQYFKSEKALAFDLVAIADYTSIELPIGLKHYFFLNNNSKLFVNASYVLDFSGKPDITFRNYENDFDFESFGNFAFGLGYNYNNKYSLEFRYYTKRNLQVNSLFYGSDYNSASIIFGYTIF